MLKNFVIFLFISFVKLCNVYNKGKEDVMSYDFFETPLRLIKKTYLLISLVLIVMSFFVPLSLALIIYSIIGVPFATGLIIYVSFIYMDNFSSDKEKDVFVNEVINNAIKTIENEQIKLEVLKEFVEYDASSFFELVLLLENPMNKLELLQKYVKSSEHHWFYKIYTKDLKIKEYSDGHYKVLETKKSSPRFISKNNYEKALKEMSLLKAQGFEINKGSVNMLNDFELIKEIRKERQALILKEKEITARIFANKDASSSLMDHYTEDLTSYKKKHQLSENMINDYQMEIENN